MTVDNITVLDAENSQVQSQSQCHWYNVGHWLKWKPTSMALLAEVEKKILSCLKSGIEKRYVKLPQSQHRIWTIEVNKDKTNAPLVMVHGMGGGVGLWAQNIDSLASKRPVYAFDLLGFGKSSRPKFGSSAQLVEMEFVESIEEWRQEMKIDKMILLGHSLGAYIVASYALKYPENINHLFLVDPWGFPERPMENDRANRIPVWMRAIAKVMSPFNPLTVVRVAGPWGPSIIRRFRPDLQAKFATLFDDETMLDYIYHCNAQTPSGETAFKTLSTGLGWAKNPMIQRIGTVDKDLTITFIYGSRTWMDKDCGYQARYQRYLNGSVTNVESVKGAGHHVYADKPEQFNMLMDSYLDNIDQHLRVRDAGIPDTDLVEDDSLDPHLKRVETKGQLEDMPLTQI